MLRHLSYLLSQCWGFSYYLVHILYNRNSALSPLLPNCLIAKPSCLLKRKSVYVLAALYTLIYLFDETLLIVYIEDQAILMNCLNFSDSDNYY